MKFGFALASAAAVAIITAHPVMASETLSAESLPAAGVSIQPAASFGDSTRVGALRKGSRVSEAEGFLPPAWLASPFFYIGGIIATVGVLDAFNIINFGILNGPYSVVA